MGGFLVTLDPVAYTSKQAAKEEVGLITRRVQKVGATECDEASFCQHVREGRSWVGGTFEPCVGGWGEFQQQQLFALDFDNDFEMPGKDGKSSRKIQLRQGDEGFLDPQEALERCERLGLKPLCLYFTLSSTCLEEARFRIVFDMGKPLEEKKAKETIKQLLIVFPEADKSCSNPRRLFFGSQGEVIECWKVW